MVFEICVYMVSQISERFQQRPPALENLFRVFVQLWRRGNVRRIVDELRGLDAVHILLCSNSCPDFFPGKRRQRVDRGGVDLNQTVCNRFEAVVLLVNLEGSYVITEVVLAL